MSHVTHVYGQFTTQRTGWDSISVSAIGLLREGLST
jgi:hypothetical protein